MWNPFHIYKTVSIHSVPSSFFNGSFYSPPPLQSQTWEIILIVDAAFCFIPMFHCSMDLFLSTF
jgi:hypothetical protein